MSVPVQRGRLQRDVQIAILRAVRDGQQINVGQIMDQVPGAGRDDVTRAVNLLSRAFALTVTAHSVIITSAGHRLLVQHERAR